MKDKTCKEKINAYLRGEIDEYRQKVVKKNK